MEIKIIEKVILTEEEMNTINEAYGIIEELYRMTLSHSKMDGRLSDLLGALSDFIDDVEITLDNN